MLLQLLIKFKEGNIHRESITCPFDSGHIHVTCWFGHVEYRSTSNSCITITCNDYKFQIHELFKKTLVAPTCTHCIISILGSTQSTI